MRVFLGAVLALLVFTAAPAEAATPGRLEFDLYRNGAKDGRHVVDVAATEGGVRVNSAVTIRVALGPLTLFRYEQTCSETWRAAALAALDCSTLKDGRRTRVEAARSAGQLTVTAPGKSETFPAEALPTSWWVRPPAFSGAMINTETGAAMPVRIANMGRETIQIGGRDVVAERVRVTGTLVVDLWYDAQNRWVGCAFTARGQRIEYRLVSPIEEAPRAA